jgi:hypothetical protein
LHIPVKLNIRHPDGSRSVKGVFGLLIVIDLAIIFFVMLPALLFAIPMIGTPAGYLDVLGTYGIPRAEAAILCRLVGVATLIALLWGSRSMWQRVFALVSKGSQGYLHRALRS